MSELVRALRAGRWLSGYAACVLAFMVVVILEGAVVRATGSGAGCGVGAGTPARSSASVEHGVRAPVSPQPDEPLLGRRRHDLE